MSWFVARTKPSREREAGENLSNQGFCVYLPIYRPRLERKDRPLFPRYLFVGFDIVRDNWGTIRSTRGVSRLLTQSDGKPIMVRDGVVEMVRRIVPSETVNHTFKSGDGVRITSGPFSGFSGICDADEGERIRILLDILGRTTLVSLPRVAIEPHNAALR